MLVPSMAFSIEKIIDWTSEDGVNIYDAIEDSFLYNSNPSNFPGIIKAYFPTEYDYITCDLDPAKITCDTPYVGYSIDEEMGTYDPDWNDDICPQYQFKPTIYASIVKHHWNQKNKYKKWWNKACEVSNEEELKEALALASGSKRIGGKFWNRRLNIRAVCKDYSDAGIGWGKKPKDPKTGEKVGVSISCRNDANDSNDIIFKPYTDEWWHAHICATELIPIADGNPEGVEPTEDAYQGHSIRVIKKIILKNDIALKSPLVVGKDKIIFVPAQSKKIYSPRVFDIEITGETPAISLTGDKFKGSSILIRKSSSDNDPLTISNLTIKNFEAPLIKYDPINDNYPRNVNVIKNTFKVTTQANSRSGFEKGLASG